jgi:hypothetical protein
MIINGGNGHGRLKRKRARIKRDFGTGKRRTQRALF